MPIASATRPRRLPSYEVLERAYRARLGTLPVNRINHREFVMSGVRYFCGYDSRISPTHPEPGWFVYDAVAEPGGSATVLPVPVGHSPVGHSPVGHTTAPSLAVAP